MVWLRRFVLAAFLGFLMGCGRPGGTEGDANDPATTSDKEQMQDETGDVE